MSRRIKWIKRLKDSIIFIYYSKAFDRKVKDYSITVLGVVTFANDIIELPAVP